MGLCGVLQPINGAGEADRRDHIPIRIANRCRDGRHPGLSLADAVGPAALANLVEIGSGECRRFQGTLLNLGRLPGGEYLGCRPGLHGEDAANGHTVTQSGGRLGGCDAQTAIAMASVNLGADLGCITQGADGPLGTLEQGVDLAGPLQQPAAESKPA